MTSPFHGPSGDPYDPNQAPQAFPVPAPQAEPSQAAPDAASSFYFAATQNQPILPLPSSVATVAAPPKKSRGKVIAFSIAGVLVAGVAGAAAYAYQTLAPHGDQPDKVLPASTVALAKVDFDPSASAKIDIYQLSQKFPSVAGTITQGKDSAKDAIVRALLSGEHSIPLNYDTDIKPWLGDRAALAAVPDPTNAAASGFDPVAVLAYTDRDKMVAAITKAAATSGTAPAYYTDDNFVVLSDTQAHLDYIHSQVKAGTLDANPTYRGDVTSLPGDQVAVGWVNLGALASSVAARTGQALNNPFASGRFVVGVHATSDYVELSGAARGFKATTGAPVNGTIFTLPSTVTAAAELHGLDSAIGQFWSSFTNTPAGANAGQQLSESTGLSLPGDIEALVGNDDTFAITDPSGNTGALHVVTSQKARALAVLRKLTAGQPDVFITATKDGYSLTSRAATKLLTPVATGALGSTTSFKNAVPNARTASGVLYVNLGARIAHSDAQTKRKYGALDAVGLSVNPGPDGGTFTLRVTTK